MLISLRDKQSNLVVKDILDIDFDMEIEEKNDEFVVKINSKYVFFEIFQTKREAEEQILTLVQKRNSLEDDLKNY